VLNSLTLMLDFSWLAGLAASGLVYLLLSRSLDVRAEQSAINASEAALQLIDASTPEG
jgi:nucleobase:cation symporter-1, NCS1 family